MEAVGAGTSWAGDFAGKALAESSKAVNFLVQGSISGAGAYLGGVATNYIAGGNGGWGDVGNLANLAGSFVSGGLGGVNLRDGNGVTLSDKVFNVKDISTMNGLAGGLASTVVNFGMTGNATFNLASIKGFGLLEVTIGKDGISAGIGSGGMSLSFETLMSAARGRKEAGKVMDWKYGTDESRSTLNGINQLGYTNIQLNHDLAKNIWNEQIGVDYADIAGYGLYKVGEKSVTLNSDLLGGGLEESAKLATVLSHEGTHLYGNRIEGIAHFHGAATYMQLLDQFKLAGDGAFTGEIMAGLTDPSSWVENTGDEDWWKQVRRNDGSFAWQEDGSLDFTFEDGTVVTAEEMKGFISRYLIKQQAQNQGVGVFSSYGTEPTNAEIAMTGVFADYLRNSSAIFPQQVVDKYAAFIIGTEAFVDASIAVQNAMTSIDNKEKGVKGYSDQKVTESLSEMFYRLEKVQESGFLEKNKIQISDNLVGHGIDTNPYLPLTGSISVTSLQGYRFVTQDFYDGLKDNSKANFPLNNFAKNKHIHTDLWSLDKSVVTSVDGSIKLNYDSTWGLNGAQFSNNSMRVYLSNHLDSNSLMNYLSVFGMDGTRMSQLQNGQYSLEGVKAGVMYATMGQTGISGGAHIDFGIYEVNNKNILSMYRDNNLNFESVYSNVYEKLNMEDDVKAYSGLSSKRWDIDERAKEVRVYMHDVLINSWNDTYKPILEVLQFLN